MKDNFYLHQYETKHGIRLLCFGDPITIEYQKEEMDIQLWKNTELQPNFHIMPILTNQDYICFWYDKQPIIPQDIRLLLKEWSIRCPNFHRVRFDITLFQRVWGLRLIAMDSHHATIEIEDLYTEDFTIKEYQTITKRYSLWRIRPYYIAGDTVYFEGDRLDLPRGPKC